MVINQSKILDQVERLHANAKDGKLKYDDKVYLFSFIQGVYEVTCNGELEIRFNTRKLAQAKRWLKEWLES